MAKKNVYVVQKFVSATSLADAIKKEARGQIVNVSLTIATPNGSSVQAVGFSMSPDGKEDIEYE